MSNNILIVDDEVELTQILLSYVKVIENMLFLFPRQFCGTNARPQEPFGMFKPFSRTSQQSSEISRILGDAVGNRTFHIVPDKLGRIKFGGVAGEEIRVNPRMTSKEPSYCRGLMYGPFVPEKHKSSLQMPEKISQENQNLKIADIFQGIETDIQGNSPFARRNTDSRNCRNLCPPSGGFKNWCLADRRPGLSNARDKTKPALVEKNQRDIKLFGLFLYAAKSSASSALFPFHPSPGLLSRASDSSSPFRAGATRYYWDDRRYGISFLSPAQSFGSSRDQSNIHSSPLLRQASAQGFVSGTHSASRGVREQVLTSMPRLLSSYASLSTGAQSLLSNRVSWLLPTVSSLYPRAQRPAGAAAQALSGFHVVSWNHDSIFMDAFLLLLRNSII